MALLQISEPGQSTAPHEHRLAAGLTWGQPTRWWRVSEAVLPRPCAMPKVRTSFLSVVRYTLEDGVMIGARAQSMRLAIR